MANPEDQSDLVNLMRSLYPLHQTDDSNLLADYGGSDNSQIGSHVDVVVSYVQELLQLDFQKLSTEEARLDEIKKNLEEAKASLVLENYRVLLDVSNEIEIISSDLPDIKQKVEKLLQSSACLEKISQLGEKNISEFAEKRQRLMKQQGCLNQVHALLEVPSLLENLAKRGLFDEAIDLIQFTEKLRNNGIVHDNSVILALVDQSRQRGWMLMTLLENQLKAAPVQLLQVLTIVSLQRRLGQALEVTGEYTIRINFLQARSAFINSLIAAIPQRDQIHFVTKIIEICRLHYFDTMNYYLSVFPDSAELTSDLRSLPFIWIQTELKTLWTFLVGLLPRIEETRLESIFKELLNMAESLARFGTNAASIFVRLWTTHVYEQLRQNLKNAVFEFRKSTDDGRIRKAHIVNQKSEPVGSTSLREQSLKAPEELTSFPALASLCNDFIDALNRLRSCFIGNLTVPVIMEINSFLTETDMIVNQISQSPGAEVMDFRDMFHRVFVPFVEKVREILCPAQEAALFLGSSLHEFRTLSERKLILEDVTPNPMETP